MGEIGLDLSFLDSIELKDTAAKGIRFNDNEAYMLKFIEYKGMKFSGYVKQLIMSDIRNHCNKSNDAAASSISKEEIRYIVMEALRENDYIKQGNNKELPIGKNEDEMLALGELGISKRT